MLRVGLICPAGSVKSLLVMLKELSFVVEALYTSDGNATVLVAAENEIHFAAPSPDEVLLRKEVELVVITGMPHLHAQVSVKTLGIGKHVVSDNPVGLCKDESLRMIQGAQYYPQLISMVALGLKQTDLFRSLKCQISSGVLTQLNLVDYIINCESLIDDCYTWLCESAMGGGALNIIGTQVIDILLSFLDSDIIRVQCNLRNFQKDRCFNNIYRVNTDDFCQFFLEFQSGVIASVTIHCSGFHKGFRQRLQVTGSNASLLVNDHRLHIQKSRESDLELVCDDKLWLAAQKSTKEILLLSLRATFMQLKEFLNLEKNTLKSGSASGSGCCDADSWQKGPLSESASFVGFAKVKKIIDALKQSNDENRWITISKDAV